MKLKHGLLIITYMFLIQCKSGPQNNNKPNIIVILTDDQVYGDVGFNRINNLKHPDRFKNV